MPDAPAATPVLSTTSTRSPAVARCHAVDRPWTPAPMTRIGTELGISSSIVVALLCLLRKAIAWCAWSMVRSAGAECQCSMLSPMGLANRGHPSDANSQSVGYLRRTALDWTFAPEAVALLVRHDVRPFALIGRWAGGGAVI